MESPDSTPARGRPSWATITAIAFAALFAFTAAVPDWLEVLGFEGLDGGNGDAEGVVLVVLGICAVIAGVTALVVARGAARRRAHVRP